jgi:hypothetical protein
MAQIILISVYLLAIIMANLLVTKFGTIAVLPVGFILVGLDITTRDYLHEVWESKLWLKMGLLIAFGSLLSWLLNKDAGMIAVASFVAFASAGIIDTLSYHLLRKKNYLVKINGSNVFSSIADSAIFLSLAFGAFMPILILEQFAVKLIGGFLWSLVIRRFNVVLPGYSRIETR